jgi:3-mercaptopyruvate sulfurtransferase SseA
MVMMKNKFILIALAVLLLTTLACNSVLPQADPTQPAISTLELPQGQDNNIPQTEAGVPRVTVEEAKAALDSGEAIIVDVRDPEFFADGHAAGAISIPLGLIESNPSGLDLDQDQWIITYCT